MLGIYLGAFLGPFGGNVVQVLLPVLQRWYGIDIRAAALSLTAYMVPFAIGQFVSGALADRFGRRPVLVAGFAGFALASLAGALAPTYALFLVARAGQGLANACTTPILMASLGDMVAAPQLGRAMGAFNAANTAGLFLAPLVAGGLATWDWRLVYALLTAVAAGLAVFYGRATGGGKRQDEGRKTKDETAPSVFRPSSSVKGAGLGDVLTWRLGALCACAFLGYWSLNGVGFLVVLYATAAFGLDSARSGLLLSAFGLANMLGASPAGMLVDRYGSVRVSAGGALGATVVLALIPLAPDALATGALLLVGGASVAALWAGLSTAAVQTSPGRRATATSLFNAWKFVGYAVAPLFYAPLYARSGAGVAFGVSAGASLLIVLPLLGVRHGAPRSKRDALRPLPVPTRV